VRGNAHERLGQSKTRRGVARAHGKVEGARRPCTRPRRQNIEHVACNGVGKVGHEFGLLLGRICPWAQNEVCSTPNALRFSFKAHGH
jgi:hypothetical protein